MLRFLKRVAAFGFGSVGLLLVLGLGWEQWARWRLPVTAPPIGEQLVVDGRLMHLNCTGSGEPTVILEAGFGQSASMAWKSTQPLVEDFTRVCSYDRAGLMWSEPGESPRDPNRIADDLHALLRAGAVPPPYVMVGHSVGAIMMRVFDVRHPGEVAGFVFVDGAHPEQQRRAPPEMTSGGGPPTTLFQLAGRFGILRLIAHYQIMGRDLSPQERAEAFRAPQSFVQSFVEISAIDSIEAQGLRAGPLDPRPIVVLTAGMPDQRKPSGASEELFERVKALRLEMQRELATLSTNSDHRTAPESGHRIPSDEPEITAQAIRDVVTAVQSGEHVKREVR